MQMKWMGVAALIIGSISLVISLYVVGMASGLRSDVAEEKALSADAKIKLDLMLDETNKLNSSLASLSDQLREAVAKIDELESEQQIQQEISLENIESFLPEEMMDSIKESMGEIFDSEELSSTFTDMMGSMAEVFDSPEMIEMSAKMQVNMQYGDYLAMFADDPARQEEIRSILMEHAMEQSANVFSMMSGDEEGEFSFEDMADVTPVSELLADVLTPEELAEYEVYEEGNTARMMRQSFDMQMSMMAGGISPEGQQLIGDIYMEEWQIMVDGMADSSNPQPMMDTVNLYEQVLARSAEYLTETEYTQFESYVDYQQTILSQFDFMNDDEEQ
ncbi:MAG: hypothetical protein COA73_07515 [Candidatus Hydrogenedentota bacterium]|nr:MAG: hypothetical protein COA73_07515 [Candidatus Hydrogenedentota bacterium]